MNEQDIFTLINQQNGNLAFKLFSFNDNSHFDHLQRNSFYTIIWIKSGNGLLKVDFSEFIFDPIPPSLFGRNARYFQAERL